MLRNFLRAIFIFLFGVNLAGCAAQPTIKPVENSINSNATSAPLPTSNRVNITAKFEITTNGTKRIFTASMYHRQSSEVYIENPDPSIIYVKKLGTTWDDFFKTLPFSLTKDCLVTGTKQTFCSNETKKLHFFLNKVETDNPLEREIKDNDVLKIMYQ